MDWLSKNIYNFFNVYWRDTNYAKTKEDLSLLDFKATHFDSDGMTVNFTCKFSKPYKLGLLVKKSDRLHIDVAMSASEYGGDKYGKDGLWLGAPETY